MPPQAHRSAKRAGSSSHLGPGFDQHDGTDIDSPYYDPQPKQSPYYRQPGSAVQWPPPARSEETAAECDLEWEMRHGFEKQLDSREYADLLSSNFFMYFVDKRHETGGIPKSRTEPLTEWRMRDKQKTSQAILFLCLNIGIDPPDVLKPKPCPRLECWIDTTRPHGTASQPPIGQIGRNLQQQYEQLSIRTNYRVYPDPTVDDITKFSAILRKSLPQRDKERLLFHYNGHGVPRPTTSGELWFFNKNYTQYIPVPIMELLSRLGAPTVFVFDCSDAAVLIDFYVRYINDPPPNVQLPPAHDDCIHLAACRAGETLPTNPDLPADLFTSCLTTPIEMAIRHFLLQSPLPGKFDVDGVGEIPGKPSERKSPLGELNWIFTAITDTIAWNSLDMRLFKRLFRQDLMIAALFRNFLLAQRVMRKYGVHPVSHPPLPDMQDHPLWESWDLAMDLMLAQLPDLRAAEALQARITNQTQSSIPSQMSAFPGGIPTQAQVPNSALTRVGTGPVHSGTPQIQAIQCPFEYQNSSFFSDQLTAFSVYLSQGALVQAKPEQLPIVMQVLLSQNLRIRALILLSKFLDLGPWAVNHALSIGIHPYVLKLLQSQALELKPVMIYIWSRILAMDRTCQFDLLKDNSWRYFAHVMIAHDDDVNIVNLADHRAMCAFVLATFCHQNPSARRVCVNVDLVEALIRFAVQDNPLLRQWSCLCLADIWRANPDGQRLGIKAQAHEKLLPLFCDPVVEVRAAYVAAMSSLLGIPEGVVSSHSGLNQANMKAIIQIEEALATVALILGEDGSAIVRREVVQFYAEWTTRFSDRMVVAAYECILEEVECESSTGLGGATGSWPSRRPAHLAMSHGSNHTLPINPLSRLLAGSPHAAVWRQIIVLSADPVPNVADAARMIVDHVHDRLAKSPLRSISALRGMVDRVVSDPTADLASQLDGGADYRPNDRPVSAMVSSGLGHGHYRSATQSQLQNGPSMQAADPNGGALARGESFLLQGIKRTASVAASLKQFAFGVGGVTSPTKPRLQENQPPSAVPSGTVQSRPHPRRTFTWAQNDTEEDPASANTSTSRNDAQQSKQNAPHETNFPMPPKTLFFDWCTEHFREPQMKASETDEYGSADYNERMFRRNRNDKIIAKTQPLKVWAATTRWEKNKGLLGNSTQPRHLCFHQFEDELIVSDNHDQVTVWDWRKSTKLSTFSNLNPVGSSITSLKLINEDEKSLIMTGSSDGVVRIFRDYTEESPVQVSGFLALSDMLPPDRSTGMILDWQQCSGHLLIAGDVKRIRVWNTGSEICVTDIPARSGSAITALTSDQVEGQVFAASFVDGAVRVYDRRIPPNDAMVRMWREHRDTVVGLHLQRGGRRELVSGARDGLVKLWDMRAEKSVATVQAVDRLSSFSMHEHAPIFAAGSTRRQVMLYNTQTVSSSSGAASGWAGLASSSGPAEPPATPTTVPPHSGRSTRFPAHGYGPSSGAGGLARAPSFTSPSQASAQPAVGGAGGPLSSSASVSGMMSSQHGPMSGITESPSSSSVGGAHRGLFSVIVPSSSFLALRVPTVPIAATCFHPHRMLIATAAENDTHISVTGCGSRRTTDEDY